MRDEIAYVALKVAGGTYEADDGCTKKDADELVLELLKNELPERSALLRRGLCMQRRDMSAGSP
jgi:hypothetical protein